MSYPKHLGYDDIVIPFNSNDNVHRVWGTGMKNTSINSSKMAEVSTYYAGMTEKGYEGEMPCHIVKEPEM